MQIIKDGLNLQNEEIWVFERDKKDITPAFKYPVIDGYYTEILADSKDERERCIKEDLPFLTLCHSSFLEETPTEIITEEFVAPYDELCVSIRTQGYKRLRDIARFVNNENGTQFIDVKSYKKDNKIYKVEIYKTTY